MAIFDSVNKVHFKKDTIVGLEDKTGEKVSLSTPVEAKGNIETWLTKLIISMQ